MSQRMLPLFLAGALIVAVLVVLGLNASGAGAQTPVATATAVPPTATPATGGAVTVASNWGFLGCGDTASITITVRAAGGAAAPDGTPVTVNAGFGTLSSATASTLGGSALVIYQAPLAGSGVATITASALGGSASTTIGVACNPAPAQLGFPNTTCFGGGAGVNFNWTPVVGSVIQFLDLSLQDNNFALFTFLGAGPLDPAQNQLAWNGLLNGRPHYWRINTLTADGWVTSATGAFVPCGGPEIRFTTYGCQGGGLATVNFFFSPASPPAISTYLDLSLANNGFVPGTFVGVPLSTTAGFFTWTGVLANQTHYWRVNSLFPGGWFPSSTGSFTAFC
jgi:hypothetical protein